MSASTIVDVVLTSLITPSPTSTSAPKPTVANQAGILEGLDPTHYNPKNPLVLFIIQMVIIIVTCRLLHWPLSYVRQPTVIAEVIGGIVLGPTVLGRIPGFMDTIFPAASRPLLALVANLGLVLFLFLVGLEVDMRMLTANYKVAVAVSAAGMIVPFGLGAGIAYGIYNEFPTDTDFGVFVLFIGVAMAITAFPVLARILTELKLLRSNVGTIVLSAGVGNDVVGWILLALTVALVNAGTGLTALYVLLVAIGWVLFLIYLVRPAFIYILRKSGSLENGPSQPIVALTLFLVLASAFFTDIIGVHAIFGGFLIGLICPHEGGFAIKLTEKIEDLVSVLFLPLYFALSGLNTNIGLLDGGIVWVYVFGVIGIAFFGKIAGGTLAARASGLVWRESLTIGVLMSCKGLVELIVLNIGLQANIISQRVFTIFVVMALVTTFATTPLTKWLYPLWYQQKLAAWKRGEITDWDAKIPSESDSDDASKSNAASFKINKISMLLRLDSLPGLFTFINLLGGDHEPAEPKVHKAKKAGTPLEQVLEESLAGQTSTSRPVVSKRRPLEVDGLRIVELTHRTSTVMKVSEVEEFTDRDPVLNVFRTFGHLNHLAISTGLSVAPSDSFAEILTTRATDRASDLLLVPWSETGAVSDSQDPQTGGYENRFTSSNHNQFMSQVLDHGFINTAILVDRGFGGVEKPQASKALSVHSIKSRNLANLEPSVAPVLDPSHHIFFPFLGGEDDRLALRFVVQLAANRNVTATVVHVVYNKDAKPVEGADISGLKKPDNAFTPGNVRKDLPRGLSSSNVPTIPRAESANSAATSNDQSTTTGTATVTSATTPDSSDEAFIQATQALLTASQATRVHFESIETPNVLGYILAKAREELGVTRSNAGDLLVLGRGKREAQGRGYVREELVGVLRALELPSGAGTELRRCLGDQAEAAIVAGVRASVLVVQAKGKGKGRTMPQGGNKGAQGTDLEITRVGEEEEGLAEGLVKEVGGVEGKGEKDEVVVVEGVEKKVE